MLITPWDFGAMLAVLSIVLLLSSLLIRNKTVIDEERLEWVARIISLAFFAVAFYLLWKSLA